jgi:hypothetical protein
MQSVFDRLQELMTKAKQTEEKAIGETTKTMDPYAVYTGDASTPMDPELLLIRDTFAGVWLFAMSDRAYPPLAARMERYIRLVEALMARKTRIPDAAYMDVSGYPTIGLGVEGFGTGRISGLNDLISHDDREEAERDADGAATKSKK